MLFRAESSPAECTRATLYQCSIDLFQGPVLAPARTTGLAGAFAAYAEGVDAIAANAAAVAVREPYSVTWFDHGLTASISFPATFRGGDFDNDGKVGFTYESFRFYTLGADVQIGPWGVGVLGDFQSYDLLPAAKPTDPQITETLGKLHADLGRSLFGGQVSVAAGVRVVTLSIDARQSNSATGQFGIGATNEVSMNGVAPEVGLLLRPDFAPWRLGATFRAAVEGRANASGSSTFGPFVKPAGIHLPWELELGPQFNWVRDHSTRAGWIRTSRKRASEGRSSRIGPPAELLRKGSCRASSILR